MRRLALAFALSLAAVAAAPAQTADKTVPQSAAELHLSFAPVVKKVRPAVVNVYASRVDEAPRNPLFDDPIFRQFFGDQGEQSRVAQSLGSGVIVDPSGLVVTNHHVIEGMTDVKVALSDRREFPAKIVLRDPRTRPRGAQDRVAANVSRCWSSAIPTRSRSATSCWRSATRSASARR